MSTRIFICLFLTFSSCCAVAEDDVRIGDLGALDKQFMAQQRELVGELAARHFGGQFTGATEKDLGLLQRILDERLVKPDQRRELQAMGLIMGDLLAADLDMHWVIYEDSQGRSRALRFNQSDIYLFPMTMIARRREVGNETPVVDIYRKAHDSVARSIPALPFR